MIDPAPIAASGAGSSFQMTLDVKDVDAQCAHLAGLGVPLVNGPMNRPWGLRTALFSDPDGHLWEIAAAIK